MYCKIPYVKSLINSGRRSSYKGFDLTGYTVHKFIGSESRLVCTLLQIAGSTVDWQWFSTYDTRVICDTLTKKLWHFAIIFMWHSWSNNIKKMTPRQKKVERTVVHYWLVTTHYSVVQVPSNLDENLSWKYRKIYK